jgi:hypothetical protein
MYADGGYVTEATPRSDVGCKAVVAGIEAQRIDSLLVLQFKLVTPWFHMRARNRSTLR